MRHKSSNKGDFLFAGIPRRMEADCHPVWGPRLGGIPRNILYTGLRGSPDGQTQLIAAEYVPNPRTYEETSQCRRLGYFPKAESPYWVAVLHDKEKGVWQTRKYKKDHPLFQAQGTVFEQVMSQTTKVGVEEDEPGDSFILP